MSAERLSKVRLGVPSDGGDLEDNGLRVPTVKRNNANTFSISYADPRPGSSRTASSVIAQQRTFLDSSEDEGDIPSFEERDSEHEAEDWARMAAAQTSMTSNAADGTNAHHFQQTPHFSRTMSMPLPSRLNHLQHPHRQQTRPFLSSPATPNHPSSPINSLSVELADSFQMVIQTMLQISPPQILESAKEQYSACSFSVPTPSISAMFTALKTLNYMSANLLKFYPNESSESLGYSDGDAKGQNVFDIGELLQGVGDALSGVAAQAGVDLVLHHGEVGVRHVYVKGDECGISYALLHIIRQILDKAHPGDLIELGLVVTPHGVQSGTQPIPEDGAEGRVTASPVDMESLRCSIKIEHRYGPNAPPEPNGGPFEDRDANGEMPNEIQRKQPGFTTLLRRLLRLVDAQFTIADNVEDGQIYEVSLLLYKTASPTTKLPAPLSGSGVLEDPSGSDTDPTVEQLLAFGETLKGRKVTLCGTTANAFTRHITSYLAAWDMDISHVFSDGSTQPSLDDGVPTPVQESLFSIPTIPVAPQPVAVANSESKPSDQENQPQISFVLIDDDVGILRERLHALLLEQHPLNLNPRARPSLVPLHRPRSSPQIARVRGQSSPPPHPPPSTVILHFTSLANFKLTKDAVQSAMSTFTGSAPFLPEVMIIPKPIGPRRFLTAMHTAVTHPTIDPFFIPTATSPVTPTIQLSGSFFPPPADPNSNNQPPQTGSPFARAVRPHGSRSNSDRSTKDHIIASLPSPSPLGVPDNVEYFPSPAEKLGLSSSSGYLVSSPDGQPAGIFFHPRPKKNASPQSLERIETPTTVQRFSGREGDSMSFSALHQVSQSPHATPQAGSHAGSPKGTEGATTPTTQGDPSSPGRRSSPESPRNENGPSPKAIGKRPAHEKQASIGKAPGVPAGQRGKASPSDGNIVPPISVLIVDDNPINQNILSTFMKRKKIRYGIANNGKEAVEKWKTGNFHLILMDIQMPIMGGIEATKAIRDLEKLNVASDFPPAMPSQMPVDASTPSASTSDTRSTGASSPYRSSVIIVALTASSLQSDRVAALSAGCNDFLTKPVSLLWLNNKIIEWGSIKALQMWADIRPEAVKNMSKGQAAQARAVAERLHMPPKKPPSRQKSITPPEPSTSAAVVTAASATAAVEYLTKPTNQDSVHEASASGPSSGAEERDPSSLPKRRRSQKRDSAPESPKTKATEVVEEAHGVAPCASLHMNNGTPPAPVPVEQEQDNKLHDAVPSKRKEEEVRRGPEPAQALLNQNSESPDLAPPPHPLILRPR